MTKNLEQYLKENLEKGVIDHAIRVTKDSLGTVTFYIHPVNADGDTLDFIVQGNKLKQLFID
ncbi:hypothetical protein PB1_16344 [Bacillus methanolicus PB1]|uniref:Uncharacterized protein n=1 Tax=Bacillus methanolicus PB1 TaxID=997296 RepID=I3DY23_BACMT|nr:hypothetical protein [Bacillus methanolicus]EIJ79144.1 hypothetical protein PB1_16344 [Bacillus methanolicus PB1]